MCEKEVLQQESGKSLRTLHGSFRTNLIGRCRSSSCKSQREQESWFWAFYCSDLPGVEQDSHVLPG